MASRTHRSSAPTVGSEPAGQIDLRDFPFMPLYVDQLLTSDTWIEAADDPRIGHAAMSLYCAAWHQVPAGTLPDNDKVLYRLSMCPTPEEWQRVREIVLRPWKRRGDGRLHHPVVCEMAQASWAQKQKHRQQTRAATAARQSRRQEATDAVSASIRDRNDVRDDTGNGQRSDERDDRRNDVRGTDRDAHQEIGIGIGRVKGEEERSARLPLPQEDLKRRQVVADRLCAAGVDIDPTNSMLSSWIDSGVTDEQLDHAVQRASGRKRGQAIPAAYLDPIVREIMTRKPLAASRRATHALPERDFATLDYSKGFSE